MPATEGPDPGEDWVIERMRMDASSIPGLALGIGDDAALFDDGRVYTVDAMVEGVHWDDKLAAYDVGWKLVAVNVSDIAAMGARPTFALLTMGLPSPLDRAWVDAFAEGLHAACAFWSVGLVGGDTVRAPVRTLSLTMSGRAARPVRRSTGRVGDDVWVTGRLGLAAEAFLSPSPRTEARAHLRRPEPPVAFAVALAEAGLATAMMDLSDGLTRDLERLCVASGCGATVDPSAVPGEGRLDWRVAFGEDYELLFCAHPDHRDAVQSLAEMHNLPVSRVGLLDAQPGMRRTDGAAWPAPLYAHFPAGIAAEAARSTAPPSGSRRSREAT